MPTLVDPTSRLGDAADDGAIDADGSLGSHRVLGRIGAGGMGEVLRVADDELCRRVAAKVARRPANPETLAKFVQEARVTGQLEHPGIVPIYALGRDEHGRPFFTMKEVHGLDLERLLDDPAHQPGLARLLGVFVKVCDAVAFAHARGVIHRDLKPANVMVGEFGEVLVMDWGLAKVLARPDDPARTAVELDPRRTDSGPLQTLDGAIAGTPAYMPPEQAAGRVGELDERADVYALGAMLYHVLTGEAPYEGADPWAVLAAVCAGPPPAPSRRTGSPVPWELEAIVIRATARLPAERYADALALKADVEAYLEGRVVGAARYSAIGAARKWLARHRTAAMIAAAVIATAGAFAGWRAMEAASVRAAARREVDELRARALGTDPAEATRVAIAATAQLEPNPVDRPVLAPAELLDLERLRERLQGCAQALSELRVRAPDELEAEHAGALRALGRVAEAMHDDALAGLAYEQAASIGGPDERQAARELAQRARGARAARLALHARQVEALLARAGDGLTESSFLEVTATLAGLRERQTIEILTDRVKALSALLVQPVRTALLDAATPDADEVRRGETPIAELAASLDAWLDARTAMRPLAPEAEQAVRRAAERLLHRRRRAGSSTATTLEQVLAGRQEAALRAGNLDRVGVMRLACEALGLLGDRQGAETALAGLLGVEFDEVRASWAARALVRLARTEDELDVLAARAHAHGTYRSGGPMAKSLDEAIPLRRRQLGVPDGEPRPQDFGARHRHIQAAIERGELGRAIELCGRLLADHPSRAAEALNQRATAYRRQGDLVRALADYDLAIERAPGTAELHLNRAVVYLLADRARDGEADARAALTLAPELGAAARFHLAQALHAQERDVEARTALDEALLIDPAHASAWVQRAEMRLDGGDLDGATRDLDQVERLVPQDPTLLLNRARVMFRQRRLDDAVAILERLASSPGSEHMLAEACYELATVRLALGEPERADQAANEALRHDPRSAQGLCVRAIVRQRLGKREAALEDARAAAVLRPGNPTVELCMAEVLHSLERKDEAIAGLTAAHQRRPDNVDLRAALAVLLVQRGGLDAAEELIREARTTHPDVSMVRHACGVLALGRGRAAEAVDHYTRELERGAERELPALVGRGYAYHALGRNELARADLDRALALDPHSPSILVARADVRLALGDGLGALMDVERACALAPRNATVLRAVARVCVRHGDTTRAHAALRDAIDAAPADPDPWLEMAALRLAMAQPALAIRSADEALRLGGRRSEALYWRGMAHRALAAHEQAIADLAAAVELSPDNWRWRANLGAAYAVAGRPLEARPHLERARRECPPADRAKLDLAIAGLDAPRK